MSQPIPTLYWQGDIDGHLVLLDQTRLPGSIEFLECLDVDQVWIAIQELSVRGAPAIGIAAAYGVCLGAQAATNGSLSDLQRRVEQVWDYLATSHPTAVNLFWALDRMRSVCPQGAVSLSASELAHRLLNEPRATHADDAEMCSPSARHVPALLN